MRHRAVQNVVVEFVGAPGVGKSYVSERLLETLRSAGHDAHDGLAPVSATLPARRRALNKIRVLAVEVLRSPFSALRITKAVAASGQSTSDVARLTQNWLVTRSMLRAARQRGGINIFDQAIVQQLGSIGMRGNWRRALPLAAPGRRDLGPDVIVMVTANHAINTGRLAGRAQHHSRVEQLTSDEQVAELQRQAGELDAIAAAWSAIAADGIAVRRFAVDNNGPLTIETIDDLGRSIVDPSA